MKRNVYACRHCHKSAYSTQPKLDNDRTTSKADRIRKRLGWDADILNLPGGNPKGMHWRTLTRLQTTHNADANQALADMMAKLGKSVARLNALQAAERSTTI